MTIQVILAGFVLALTTAAVILTAKLILIKKSLREIRRGLKQRLEVPTNTLIDTTSRDRDVVALREALNDQLRSLRSQRQRYQQGDQQLKQAVTQISHDLRTPLTAICGYLQLAEKEPVSPRCRQIHAILSERAETMKQLTQQLFSYSVSVLDSPSMLRQRVDLRGALEKNLAAVVPLFEKQGLRPAVTMPDMPVIRVLDPGALDRILQNLLENAAKYGGSGLAVTLSPQGVIELIDDAGQLSQIEAAQLFDRYYTVHTGAPSTGLGLAIARGLSEQLGGSLTGGLRAGKLIFRLSFPPGKDQEEE